MSPNHNTLAQSFAALPPATRLKLSLSVCAVAGIGLLISDYLEAKMPPPPKINKHHTEE
ncbi:hypothetical protein AMATHDRAFT_2256 [Amanita thiersii Skay4041]|uniref:Uncharacterized protein n=1 Tax=Amanita thiersii Skay4041 TaxID=703135 RepID=A0A2A9NWU2_9AGAR|nr:hypothetical protein AMATHDRAFT_2256 [Amanita thiersii Skay4041]